MEDAELLEILKKINSVIEDPVDEDLLAQIISLEIMNPLDDDRGKCQDQILEIVNQRIGGKNDYKRN